MRKDSACSSEDLWQEDDSRNGTVQDIDAWTPSKSGQRQPPHGSEQEPLTPISVSKAWPGSNVRRRASPREKVCTLKENLDRDRSWISALGAASTISSEESSFLRLKAEPVSPRCLPTSIPMRHALQATKTEAEKSACIEDATRPERAVQRLLRSREVGICRAASVSAGLWGVPIRASNQRIVSCDASEGMRLVPVTLHVYDLTWLTKLLQLPVFHLGVEVYQREYSFGSSYSGVVSSKPLANEAHKARHREAVPLGYTLLSSVEVSSVIKQLSLDWPASSYDVLSRNCVTFAVTFCRHLGVERRIPPEYSRFAEFGCVSNCRGAASCRNITPFPGEQDIRDFEIANVLEIESDEVNKASPQLRL